MDSVHDDVIIEPEDDGAEENIGRKLKKVRDELKMVKAERDEYLAGWQRSKADYVNLSRRIREQEASLTQGTVIKIIRSIISVFDSLEAAHKVAEGGDGTTLKGIELVTKQMEDAMKEHGVIRFTPKSGDAFDPNMHEPMAIVATKEQREDNTVSATHQSGYEIAGAVIRPARVSVAHYQHDS